MYKKANQMYLNLVLNVESRIKSFIFKKSKGEVNYFLAMGIICAALLIVAWPIVKNVMTNVFNTVNNWFTSNLSKVFGNVS